MRDYEVFLADVEQIPSLQHGTNDPCDGI